MGGDLLIMLEVAPRAAERCPAADLPVTRALPSHAVPCWVDNGAHTTVPALLNSGSVPMTDASTRTDDDLGLPFSTRCSLCTAPSSTSPVARAYSSL